MESLVNTELSHVDIYISKAAGPFLSLLKNNPANIKPGNVGSPTIAPLTHDNETPSP